MLRLNGWEVVWIEFFYIEERIDFFNFMVFRRYRELYRKILVWVLFLGIWDFRFLYGNRSVNI